MKLVRFGNKGYEKPGAIDQDGRIRNLSELVIDWTPATLTLENLNRFKRLHLYDFPLVEEARLAQPITDVGKVIGIGLNYVDHAEEAGLEPPKEPIMFLKASSALSGPNDAIELPPEAKKVDWEVELGVVFGRHARSVAYADALDYVAGYLIANDVSERYWQLECGTQWDKGKSADTFCPIGPYLVTADEIADPQNLALSLAINGRQVQQGHTSKMIFSVQQLIHQISIYTTLNVGDLMITGTPPGVGFGMNPQRFLKANDELELSIDGLGQQNYRVIERPE